MQVVRERRAAWGTLTLGDVIDIAEQSGVAVHDVVIAEATEADGLTREQVLSRVIAAFSHNLQALEVGLTRGVSFLLGRVGSELAKLNERESPLIGDSFLNKALTYTLATEVGNHEVGLQPCAGTGDSCVYTGLLKAMLESEGSQTRVAEATAVMLKVGSIFRPGKSTTGCNMEGLGAGAAGVAAALADLRGATPPQLGKAVVLALSPTLAVPCTPRVMVPGLCATHIGGAILLGNLAANLALKTSLPVNVDVDVMIALAAAVHRTAAVPVTRVNLEYMRPFFKVNPSVEEVLPEELKGEEQERFKAALNKAKAEARRLASQADSIVDPFGEVVIGGSSIAVGSPTNMARIAHTLARGPIQSIRIELTSDLFARRGINIPRILMGALYGVSTGDVEKYDRVMEEVRQKGLDFQVVETEEPEVQRIWVKAAERDAMVHSLNRGGGRLALIDALPSLEEARQVAKSLGIEVVS